MDKIDTRVVKADIGYMYKRVNEQMQRGIRVKKQEKYVEYLTELASDLATKAKMSYGINNIASTTQVAAYLSESSKKYKLGAKNDIIDCCYDSGEGKFKTDAKSLGRLAELGYEFAKDVLEYRTVQSYLRAFKWADGFEDMNGMVRPNVSLTLTNRITYSKPNLIGIRKDVTWNTVAPLTENDVMYSIDIKNEEPTILLNLVGDNELLEGLKSEEGLYNTMFKKVFEPKTVATVILDKSVPSHKLTHKEIMSDPRILGLPSKYSTGCHSIFYEGKEVLAVENIFFSYDGGHSSLPSTVGIELVDGVVDIPVQWDMEHANVDTNGSTVEGRLIGLEINIRKSDRDEFKRSWLSYTYGASMNSIRFGCKSIDGARVADYLGHIKSINKYKSLVKKAVKDGANFATTVFGNQLVVNEFDEGKRIRTMMNAPIQGTGADILAISIKRLDDEIARRGWGNVMQMYYTRHDEIVVNVNKEFADAHDAEIKDMLRDVVAFQIVHNGVEWTPLKVEISRIIPQPIHINIEDAGDEEE